MRRYIQALLIVARRHVPPSRATKSSRPLPARHPNLEPTFSQHSARHLSKRADVGRTPGLHRAATPRIGRTPAGGLNLDRADRATTARQCAEHSEARQPFGRFPAIPTASYLVQKVEGGAGIVGVRMPLNGPYLTAGQILILRRWIELGAPQQLSPTSTDLIEGARRDSTHRFVCWSRSL